MSKTIRYILILILAVVVLKLAMAGVWTYRALTPEPWVKAIAVGADSVYYTYSPVDGLRADSGLMIGQPLTVSGRVTASPYYAMDPAFSVSLPEGLTQVGKPEFEIGITAPWAEDAGVTYDFKIVLSAYRPDTYTDLTPTVRFKGVEKMPDTTLVLPAFAPLYVIGADIEDSAVLVSAGKLDVDSSSVLVENRWIRWLVIGAAGLIGLMIVIVLLVKRKKHIAARVTPPWEVANRALDHLAKLMSTHDISGEVAAARLTDIVRLYLTARFGLPASSTTTQEFFKLLARPESPLMESHRAFLNRFLEAADLIKFAGFAADDQMILNAIAQARQLVGETLPKPEGSA